MDGDSLAHKLLSKDLERPVLKGEAKEGSVSGSPGEPHSVPSETGITVTHFRQKGHRTGVPMSASPTPHPHGTPLIFFPAALCSASPFGNGEQLNA